MSYYRLEVSGAWAGRDGSWRPAFDGTWNQSGLYARSASTFDSFDEADAIRLDMVREASGGLLDSDGIASAEILFRVVEAGRVGA